MTGAMLTQLSSRPPTGPRDLVDLLGECHERIRRSVALARRAASRRDAPPDQVVQACVDVERYFTEALPLHVADEEESVEPRLRGSSPAVDRALDAMTRQHEQHGPRLEALLRATSGVRSDPHDEVARGELAAAALALETELEEHLQLEERVIFPAIRESLSRETQAIIVDELRRRRRPVSRDTIIRYLESDHARLHALLDRAMALPHLDLEAFAAFRRGLLRHIAIEEKVLLPAVREARGGQPLDRAHELRIDHAALTSLLVPTPDLALCRELRALLSAHDAKEEAAGGVYEECKRWLNEDALVLLAERATSFPEVPVARHFDGPEVARTAEGALASARRLRAPKQRRPG